MNWLRWLSRPILSAALLVSPSLMSAAMAQLADRGFDTQGGNTPDFCFLSSTCPAGAWVGSGAGFVHQFSPSWSVGAVVSPNHALFMQGLGGAAQSFTVPTSGTYRLTWWDAGRPAGSSGGSSWSGNETYIVKINTTVVATMSTTSGQAFTRKSSATFNLVSGTSYTLTFLGTINADETAFIDGITLSTGSPTVSYNYDALGRLISSSVSGGVNNGIATSTTFDTADNRSNYSVTGVPTP